jgi:hypothetical protein
MHPVIQLEIAKSRAADMQRRAERERVARAAHAARAADAVGSARAARQEPRSVRGLSAPRKRARRLLRLS